MLTTYYIYTLSNPTNGELFYVGCTSNTTVRLAQHRSVSATGTDNTETGKYLKTLKGRPVMSVVQKIKCNAPVDNNKLPKPALDLERSWIIKKLNAGCPLTNTQNAKWYKIGDVLSSITETAHEDYLRDEPIVKPKYDRRTQMQAAKKVIKIKREKKVFPEFKSEKRGKLSIAEMNTLESMRESFPSYKMFYEFIGVDGSMISWMIDIGSGEIQNIEKIKKIIHGDLKTA